MKRGAAQARGNVRRSLLIEAARQLLRTHDVDTINLADVAEQAGIPKSSAYHFYPEANALFAELAVKMADELRQAIDKPVPERATWTAILHVLMERGIDFIVNDSAVMRLLLGPKTSFEIKRSDRVHDKQLACAIIKHIEYQFVLPPIDDRDGVFFRAIEILDLFLSLAVQDHGELGVNARAEAHRAAHAYLALYIPQILVPAAKHPAREGAGDGAGRRIQGALLATAEH